MFDKEKLLSDAIAHQKKSISLKIFIISAVFVIIGTVFFLLGVFGNNPQRTWQIFLVNFLFFTGLSQGMVVFASALQLTNAKWGRPVKRIAELGAYFLPLSLISLVILYFGRTYIFTWIEHPIPEKAFWLNATFLFSRDFIGFLILAVLSFLFLKISVKPDLETIANQNVDYEKTKSKLHTLAPILAIAFAFIYSLIAFDLIMALDPHWYSTLFGAYFFITSFYTGMAALVVTLALSREFLGLDEYIGPQQFHDIGKLLFGFCVVAGDFFWSQFLVIWYGNIPEETVYVILRLRETPWNTISYIVLFTAFVIPFILMISRKFKRNPKGMMTISILILIGVWFERVLLIFPSIWHEHTLPLGISEIIISLGFLAGFIMVYLFAVTRHPLLPVTDPLMQEYLEHGVGH